MSFVLTPPYEYQSTVPKCVMRIDDNWYDCTTWRRSHPGGAEICDAFHGKDATDAFYSLHSKDAIRKLKAMKALPLREEDEPRDKISENFKTLTKQLEAEGWYERDWFVDFSRNIIPVLLLCAIGTWISSTSPIVATVMIGIGMQQAGWIAHDYTHGRGTLSRVLAVVIGGFINGFSVSWWSHKHNTHHVFPNRKGRDVDIHNEPVIFLWVPDVSDDSFSRQYQYIYYPFAYSLLYVSWRMQSIIFALGSRNKVDMVVMGLGYVWLALLPWKVMLGSIILGGFCVAIVVTANHQTEEMIEMDEKYNFIVDQYRTTRGVHCADPFFEWFFGGMQYQLEHHLLPTVPRYRYPAARRLLRKFSEENNLPFHVSGVLEILKLNFQVLRQVSEAASPKEKSK